LEATLRSTPRREPYGSRPVIPVYIGYCAVFKVREEASPPPVDPGRKSSSRRQRAGLSKLNSMHGAPSSLKGRLCASPDSVDMSSGRSCSRRAPRPEGKTTILLTIGAL
jgi:hypothetical protein